MQKKLARMVKKNVMKVDSYAYNVSPYEKDGLTGASLSGIAKQKGKGIVINSVIVTKGKDLWETTVTYNDDSNELDEIAVKVLKSVAIR